jgi:hypothetical protein
LGWIIISALVLGVLWETRTETRDSEARKPCFIVPAQTQWTSAQRLSPENKGLSPYVPLQARYRGNKIEKQGFYASASALLPLVLHDLLHVWILLVLSLCCAIPSPLLLYQNTGLSVSLLVLLPATSFPRFEAWTHLGSKSIILI